MLAKRIEITVSAETWERLNTARGHEPRASFVKRALDAALAGPPSRAAIAAEVREVLDRADPEVMVQALRDGAATKPAAPVFDPRAAAMERQRAMNKAKGL